MAKIGFIGMGNMGYAMLKGALAAFSPSDIIFSSPDRGKCCLLYTSPSPRDRG